MTQKWSLHRGYLEHPLAHRTTEMAPSLKLYYFDMSGRAEPIRLILKSGQVPFEDYRIQREDWSGLKAEMPYGQVPVLEVDGKKIAQSMPICRYVAKLAKLDGEDDIDKLQIDSVVETLSEVQKKLMDMRFEKDESKKATLKENLLSNTIPFIFKKLDAQAAANGGYIASKKFTWADIIFTTFYEAARNALQENVFISYPNLNKVKQNVLSVPVIKNHIQNRAENKMFTFDLKSEL